MSDVETPGLPGQQAATREAGPLPPAYRAFIAERARRLRDVQMDYLKAQQGLIRNYETSIANAEADVTRATHNIEVWRTVLVMLGEDPDGARTSDDTEKAADTIAEIMAGYAREARDWRGMAPLSSLPSAVSTDASAEGGSL